MKYFFFCILTSITFHSLSAQEMYMKPLKDLINTEDPGWAMVLQWKKDAKNKIEILPKNPEKADTALYRTQVTTRSPMGAIIYETGGILIDHGWIRILGSGSEILTRDLPSWNKGKSFDQYGEIMPFLLIADDAMGGFFALNGGAFGHQDLGKVYYFAPDNLKWEPLNITYTDFIFWAFNGDIDQFYSGYRWENWKEDVEKMGPDRAMIFYPYLWSKYDNFNDLSRKDVPISEMWTIQINFRNQLINVEME